MAWQIPHGLAPLVPWCRDIKDRDLIWMFWKRTENFLLHSGKFTFFTYITSTFMLG